MTYQRLLIIASGILVNQFDIEQAQGLHHDAKDKKATPVQQILDPANSTDLDTQLDQVSPWASLICLRDTVGIGTVSGLTYSALQLPGTVPQQSLCGMEPALPVILTCFMLCLQSHWLPAFLRSAPRLGQGAAPRGRSSL